MELRRVVPLRGPNVWASCPMLEVWVDLADLAAKPRPSPAFEQLLAAWLPLLPDPADQGHADGLLARLRDGLSPVEILQALLLRLQRAAGCRPALRRGFHRPAGGAGAFRVAVEFEEESLARLCLTSAWRMLLAAAQGTGYDAAAELAALRAFADRYCLGPSTRAIVEAARKRNIPARRLNDRSLVQFGHGVHQRRIFTAETDRTSAIAEGIAQDKDLTKTLLRAVGVPVPAGRLVADAADAWLAAVEIGLPVVIKPRDANHGRGVALNLSTQSQIEAAYALAVGEGDGVIVEQCVRGGEHRLLVVGDQVVAASRGEPEQVIGDGRHTIAQLVDILNRDPRRGLEFAFPLGKVELDPAGLLALDQQGYTPESVPPARSVVLIHRNGDFTTDETDDVHPDVAAQAVLAAKVVGLDVAGVDIIAENIARPLKAQGGMVIEVNAGPGLHMHLEPQRGRPRAVGEMILQSMFPLGHSGRIPLVAVCGSGGPLVSKLAAHLLHAAGYCVGTASHAGVWVDERRLDAVDGTLPERAGALLLHPMLTAAVFETSGAAILDAGLPFELCDVAIFGQMSPDFARGNALLDARYDDGELERVVAETVSNDGHLLMWAGDPRAEQTAAAGRAGIIWLSTDATHPRLLDARRQGARAAFVRDNTIWFAVGQEEWPLAGPQRASALAVLAEGYGWEPLLAATAAGWGIGLSDAMLAAGLATLVVPADAGAANGNGA